MIVRRADQINRELNLYGMDPRVRGLAHYIHHMLSDSQFGVSKAESFPLGQLGLDVGRVTICKAIYDSLSPTTSRLKDVVSVSLNDEGYVLVDLLEDTSEELEGLCEELGKDCINIWATRRVANDGIVMSREEAERLEMPAM